MARQGVRYPTLDGIMVADPATHAAGAARRHDAGRGHAARQHRDEGLPEEPAATGEAFAGGWFHTGDLAVRHPDGYVEIKDRSKDIIISGGENISSLEVEEALYRHPAVMEAAVVAHAGRAAGASRPAPSSRSSRARRADDAEDIIAWCRERLAHFKVPSRVVFGPLPKTSTGKIQKYELRERARRPIQRCGSRPPPGSTA